MRIEARSAERISHYWIAMTQQKRCLQHDRHKLDDDACSGLGVIAIRQMPLELVQRVIETRV